MNSLDITNIRFPYLPPESGLPDLLKKEFGYKVKYEEGEWRLSLNDRGLRTKRSEVLKWHPRISLEENLSEAARKMVVAVPPDYEDVFEQNIDRPKDPIQIVSAFGLSADVRTALIEVLLAAPNDLAHVIEEYVFPLMIDRFGMKYVFPVSLFAKRVQTVFSLAKICLLAEEKGIEEAQHRLNKGAMQGIEMTGGLAVLNMLDPLTRFAPIAFTYPVNRFACSWHFYKDGFDMMPLEGIRSAFHGFLMSDSPRATQAAVYGLFSARGFNEQVIWQLLREGVNGLNRLFGYISDFRNFLRSDGTVDFASQLKAFGTVRMLFADLHGMNLAMNAHSRITFTFGFLDKLSNLIAGLRGLSSRDERSIFMGLASRSRGRQLEEIFEKSIGSIHEDFSDAILPAIQNCYKSIHSGLGKQLESEVVEKDRLKRFTGFRNMNHGTFLTRDQFENLFFLGKGELPDEVMTLPYLLTWGLMADPKKFILFDADY